MADFDHQQKGHKPLNARKSSITLPSAVPRSQYASNSTTSRSDRSTASSNAPRYFSSPYREPLAPQKRHESFVQHQISITSIYSNDSMSVPGFTPKQDHSSRSFSGPGPAIEGLSTMEPMQSVYSQQPLRYNQPASNQDNGVVRQASIGHKARPAVTTVTRFGSLRDRQNTVERDSTVLTEANMHDMRHEELDRNQYIRPVSPSSTYSHDASPYEQRLHLPSNTTTDYPRGMSPIAETAPSSSSYNDGRVSPMPETTPHSQRSMASTNPLLMPHAEIPKRKSKIPEMMRPPRLDMEAVRQAEARGSMTSLPDLIRRATRLAANLDHGRTASTLSVFDLFKSYEKTNTGNRKSTYSDVNDMLASFPNADSADRARGASEKTNRAKPEGEVFVSEVSDGKTGRQKRRCCGLSTSSIIAIIVVVILLCAAAVLLPIFLVAVPNQRRSHALDLSKCSSSFPCQNGGISIVDNDACSCICVNGFTSNDCSTAGDPECITNDVAVGSEQFHNATMGQSIGTVLLDSSSKFRIPLNVTVLLSIFASDNITCAGEDSLVKFNADSRFTRKRAVRSLWAESNSGSASIGRNAQDRRRSLTHELLPTLQARQTSVQTSDDIVFQTTSTQAVATTRAITSTATGAPVSGSNSTSTGTPVSGSNSTSTGNTTASLTPDQYEFAQIVVLYVLGVSRAPSIAVTAQQMLEQYFRAGALASGNDTVNVMNGGENGIVANFAQLAIVLGNGQVVGGNATNV